MVSFTKATHRGLLLLLLILIAALAVPMIFPFYRGVHEGLTGAELDSSGKIKQALLAYTNTVEMNCQKFMNGITSLSGLSQTETLSINTIIGNTNFTNTAKMQQIIALNSTSEPMLKALNGVQGQNFTALLTMMQAMPTTTTDTQFNRMVNQQMTAINKILNTTDMTSPYYTINTYVQNTKLVHK